MSYAYRSIGRPATGRSGGSRRAPSRQNGKDYIDPTRFIRAAEPQHAEAYVPKNMFTDFPVEQLLLDNIAARGLTTPSPIQDEAIPAALAGHDVVGVANTGTGKTIAFALPMLHSLLTNPKARALILAPTRELATQIEDECKMLARTSGLHGVLIIGGASINVQLKNLRQRPSIVIGTPGRVQDHIDRGSLNVSDFSIVVLDEVDRMLDMGFVNAVRSILSELPARRQSFFFTATLDSTVGALIREFSHDPVTISVKTGDTAAMVEQDVIRFSGKTDRMERLHDLLLRAPKALVFDDTQRSVERLLTELLVRGFATDAIHGGKSQGQRQRALARFKANEINVLVATDVAARGLDITGVTHVINFSQPRTYDDYVHRIGRAGRAGKAGHAFTFVEQ